MNKSRKTIIRFGGFNQLNRFSMWTLLCNNVKDSFYNLKKYVSARDVKRPSTPPEPYPASDEDRSRSSHLQLESPPSMSSVLANAYRDRGGNGSRHRPPSPIDSPPILPPPSKGPRTPPSPKKNPPSPPPVSLSPRSKRHRTPPADFENPPSKRRRSRDRDTRELSRDRRRPADRDRDRYEDKRPRSPPRYSNNLRTSLKPYTVSLNSPNFRPDPVVLPLFQSRPNLLLFSSLTFFPIGTGIQNKIMYVGEIA
jgi:hypothetical protein